MRLNKHEFGKWGEQVASDYLFQKGYTILGRNIRTPHGEIDILALKDQIMVFVEVKTRSSETYGYPETSIDARKLNHMEASALFYIQNNGFAGTWQCDAIAIFRSNSKPIEIVHFENIIT